MSYATYPSLAGRHVVVTGGASGIGEEIVRQFAAQASLVDFLDLDVERGEALARELPNAYFHACDLRDVESLRTRLSEIEKARGPVRALVNNAGRDDRSAIEEVTPAAFDEGIAVNLRHQFFAAQALGPGMTKVGGGSIVNLGSICWLLANGGYPVYATSKAAISGLTRALARDWGPRGIRVNTVLPGWILTERQIRLWLTPEAEEELLRAQCLPVKLGAEDVARMVLWLAADDSRHVTAQSFVVDGGRS